MSLQDLYPYEILEKVNSSPLVRRILFYMHFLTYISSFIYRGMTAIVLPSRNWSIYMTKNDDQWTAPDRRSPHPPEVEGGVREHCRIRHHTEYLDIHDGLRFRFALNRVSKSSHTNNSFPLAWQDRLSSELTYSLRRSVPDVRSACQSADYNSSELPRIWVVFVCREFERGSSSLYRRCSAVRLHR